MPYGKVAPKLPGWMVDARYDIATYYPGVPGNNQTLLFWTAPRRVRLYPNLPKSQASSGTAATASATCNINRNGSQIGTLNFAAAATVATFSFAALTVLSRGDVLTIVGPAAADATLADIAITLAGSA
jgi:hypothetical protein